MRWYQLAGSVYYSGRLWIIWYSKKQKKYTPGVRLKISSKVMFTSCVWYSDRAYYWVCVLVEDIVRRLPLELACTRVNKVMFTNLCAEAIKSFRGGDKNLTDPVEFTSLLRKHIPYKGSAWMPAYAGTHASGRAGQHFELFDSILGVL